MCKSKLHFLLKVPLAFATMSIQTTYPEFYLNGILCRWHIVMEGQQMAPLAHVINSAPVAKSHKVLITNSKMAAFAFIICM